LDVWDADGVRFRRKGINVCFGETFNTRWFSSVHKDAAHSILLRRKKVSLKQLYAEKRHT
jgi:hypothetical protein